MAAVYSSTQEAIIKMLLESPSLSKEQQDDIQTQVRNGRLPFALISASTNPQVAGSLLIETSPEKEQQLLHIVVDVVKMDNAKLKEIFKASLCGERFAARVIDTLIESDKDYFSPLKELFSEQLDELRYIKDAVVLQQMSDLISRGYETPQKKAFIKTVLERIVAGVRDLRGIASNENCMMGLMAVASLPESPAARIIESFFLDTVKVTSEQLSKYMTEHRTWEMDFKAPSRYVLPRYKFRETLRFPPFYQFQPNVKPVRMAMLAIIRLARLAHPKTELYVERACHILKAMITDDPVVLFLMEQAKKNVVIEYHRDTMDLIKKTVEHAVAANSIGKKAERVPDYSIRPVEEPLPEVRLLKAQLEDTALTHMEETIKALDQIRSTAEITKCSAEAHSTSSLTPPEDTRTSVPTEREAALIFSSRGEASSLGVVSSGSTVRLSSGSV